jgi:hypothetical protein
MTDSVAEPRDREEILQESWHNLMFLLKIIQDEQADGIPLRVETSVDFDPRSYLKAGLVRIVDNIKFEKADG